MMLISRPLFKQSMKANLGNFIFVSLITCIMLAIVILVMGNLQIDTIQKSMSDIFIEDGIKSACKEKSISYYNLAYDTLDEFDEKCNSLDNLFNVTLIDSRDEIIENYNTCINNGKSHDEAIDEISNENTKTINEVLISYYLVNGNDFSKNKIEEYTCNLIIDNIKQQLHGLIPLSEKDYVISVISSGVDNYINLRKQQPSITIKSYASDYISGFISDNLISQKISYNNYNIVISDYFTVDELNDVCKKAILVYNAELDDYIINHPDCSKEELDKEKNKLISENSSSLFLSFDEELANSLSELGNLDFFTLVLGSIFYKMAGLLLPFIFIIMCSNNLISNQIDNGSLAFVLSTPVKRNKVAFTQLVYLFVSILTMYLLMTLVSVVCFKLIDSSKLSIDIYDLFLFNLGGFVTSLSIGGICFLTSCIFNRSKLCLGIGGGISIFFLVCTILGLFGSDVMPAIIRISSMNYFNYFTLVSFFDISKIIASDYSFYIGFCILSGIYLITSTIGIIVFCKKDLPL